MVIEQRNIHVDNSDTSSETERKTTPPKVLALLLPAFHRIPENDEWWGEGFTEWDNVKKGKPLYSGHEQPLVPYDNYYYDLSKEEDIVRQANLAKKYSIGGFIYYHYWFNGKLLLEKPAELYLHAKDKCDFPYCFCWANETWARTWDGKSGEVLIEQTFGGVKDWEKHIDYLLKFFKDPRYIKRNNKPMLFVYSASRITDFDKMMDYWNSSVKKEGFDGIYLVEFINNFNSSPHSKYSEAVTEFEPMYTNRYDIGILRKGYRFFCKKFKRLESASYDKTWEAILKRTRTYEGREIIPGCFTAWDNTARKGNAGTVFKGASPEKFKNYFRRLLMLKRESVSNEYVIINAWNEWGEGAILEPSTKDGFGYLMAVDSVIKEISSSDSLNKEGNNA